MLNRELLKEVRENIKHFPEQFLYNQVIQNKEETISYHNVDTIGILTLEMGACGCVAGFTYMTQQVPATFSMTPAKHLLGLDDVQEEFLFRPWTWEEGNNRYEKSDLAKVFTIDMTGWSADEAIARIDHLLSGEPLITFVSPMLGPPTK